VALLGFKSSISIVIVLHSGKFKILSASSEISSPKSLINVIFQKSCQLLEIGSKA
jgi:hypothetical protein